MSTTYRLSNEPSAWLRGALAKFRSNPDVRTALDFVRGRTTLVTPLGEGDRKCDRCSTDVAEGGDFYPFMARLEPGLVVIVGMCADCIQHEAVVPSE